MKPPKKTLKFNCSNLLKLKKIFPILTFPLCLSLLIGCGFDGKNYRTWYEKSWNTVYFNHESRDEPETRTEVAGVDMSSFVILDESYAKDKNTVYHNGKTLDQADPSTFKVIGEDYAKDKTKVYNYKGIIVGADPESFEVIQDIFLGYAKDDFSAFFDGKKVEGADPTTFEYISQWYAKDMNSVYVSGQRIDGADPNSFEAIDDFFSKDKNSVYAHFDGRRLDLPNFDPKTFKVVNSNYLKDKEGVYYYGGALSAGERVVVMDADLETFELCCDGVNFTCEHEEYAKDSSRVYYRGYPLEGEISPSTQRVLNTLNEAGLCLTEK